MFVLKGEDNKKLKKKIKHPKKIEKNKQNNVRKKHIEVVLKINGVEIKGNKTAEILNYYFPYLPEADEAEQAYTTRTHEKKTTMNLTVNIFSTPATTVDNNNIIKRLKIFTI